MDKTGKERSSLTGEIIKPRRSSDEIEYERTVDQLRIIKASNSAFADAQIVSSVNRISKEKRGVVNASTGAVKLPDHLRAVDIRYQQQIASRVLLDPKREVPRLSKLLKAA